MRSTTGTRALATLGVLALLPGLAWAQGEQNGAVAGTVRDTTRAALPGVTVEASSCGQALTIPDTTTSFEISLVAKRVEER